MHDSIPSGQSPPFLVIDDDRRGGIFVIGSAVGIVVSLVCLSIRLYVRLVLCPPFAYDDLILLAATAGMITHLGIMYRAVARGFGNPFDSLGQHDFNLIGTLIPIGDIFYLISIYLTKCCMLATYLRLTNRRRHNQASWATLALCTAWVLVSVLIISVNCEFNSPRYGFYGDSCPNLLWRWRFIGLIDTITEVILFTLAVSLLNGFYMYLLRKVALWIAFFFRLPIIIFIVLRLYSIRLIHDHHDIFTLPPKQAIEPANLTQAHVHFALIACSVFCFHPFMSAVHTNCGIASGTNLERTRQLNPSRDSRVGFRSPSVPLSSAKSSGALQRVRQRDAERNTLGRTEEIGFAPIEREEPGTGDSGGDSNSMAIEVISSPPPAAVTQASGDADTNTQDEKTQKEPGGMCIRKDVEYSVEYGKAQLSTQAVIGTQSWDLYFRGYAD